MKGIKRVKKKLLLITMALSVLMSTACGRSTTDAGTSVAMNKEHVYKEKSMSELMDTMKVTNIYDFVISKDRLYVNGSYSSEDGSGYIGDLYASINLDGTDARTFSLTIPEAVVEEANSALSEDSSIDESGEKDSNNGNASAMTFGNEAQDEEDTASESVEEYTLYNSMSVNPSGNFVILKNRYVYNNTDYTSKNNYSVVIYSQNGELIQEKAIEPVINDTQTDNDSEYIIEALVADNEGNMFCVENYKKVVKFDSEINRKTTYEIPNIASVTKIFVRNNKIYVIGWDNAYDRQLVWIIDDKLKQIAEGVKLPTSGEIIAGNDKYELYIYDDKCIKGWNTDSSEAVTVMSYIDSDAPISYVDRITCSKEGFIILYSNIEDYKTYLSEYIKVEPENISEKHVITLACRYLDYRIKSRILTFNKNSEKYRIQVTDYSDYNTYDDYTAGITKMNLDIMSGKIPDIIVLDEELNLDSYIQKGMLADLSEMMKDNNIDINQFMPNIIRIYSREDKLYCIVPNYYIKTYMAKESLVGNKSSWSIKDAENLLKSMEQGTQLFDRKTRGEILQEGIFFSGSDFVNLRTGVCNFNSDDFISLLELAKGFPQDLPEVSNDYWMEYEQMYRANKTILMETYISSVRDLNYQEKTRMGEKASFAGFPGGCRRKLYCTIIDSCHIRKERM